MRKSIAAFLGVLTLAIVLALVYWAIRLSWRALSNLPSEIALGIIAAGATLLGSVLTLVLSRAWERRKSIEESQRLKKTAMYEEFIAFWFRVLYADKLGTKVTEREMLEFMLKFTERATTWASADFVRVYGKWRSGFTRNPTPKVLMLEFEQVLLAIRRDLGHPTSSHRPGDLLRLWMNDVDELVAGRVLGGAPPKAP